MTKRTQRLLRVISVVSIIGLLVYAHFAYAEWIVLHETITPEQQERNLENYNDRINTKFRIMHDKLQHLRELDIETIKFENAILLQSAGASNTYVSTRSSGGTITNTNTNTSSVGDTTSSSR